MELLEKGKVAKDKRQMSAKLPEGRAEKTAEARNRRKSRQSERGNDKTAKGRGVVKEEMIKCRRPGGKDRRGAKPPGLSR